MFILISEDNLDTTSDVLESAYRFRHDFFVGHLKWEACRKSDGREVDEFDGPDCYHIVGLDGDEVVSYSRLLPTTRPHLQTHLYPEILQGAAAPTGPTIYEWTRCAVAPSRQERASGKDAVSGPSFTAVAEAVEWLGLDGLLVQTHPLLVSRLMGFGWHVESLALPSDYDGSLILPIFARLTPATVARSRQAFGLTEPVLTAPELGFPTVERRAAQGRRH